jgi:hypothetical protein
VVGTAQEPRAGRGNSLALTRLALLGTLVLAGCASGDAIVVPDRERIDLERFRAEAEVPPYWVGREFEGLPLTAAESGTLIYGTCEIEDDGPFTEGGCAPPVQVQNLRFEHRQWAIAQGCHRLTPVRGVPAARHDSLVLFTDRQFVKIYALDAEQELRVAEALRPLDGRRSATLPQPPRDVLRRIRTVCR